MTLKYRVDGEVTMKHVVTVRDAVQSFCKHRDDPVKGFGSRALETVPVVLDKGKVVAKINYNGTLV